MTKDLNVSNLIMLYGATLNERTRNILKAYYDLDMSLFEIAGEFNLSRQGARDIIVRYTDNLYSLDKALDLQQKFNSVKECCSVLSISQDKTVCKNADRILNILFEE